MLSPTSATTFSGSKWRPPRPAITVWVAPAKGLTFDGRVVLVEVATVVVGLSAEAELIVVAPAV